MANPEHLMILKQGVEKWNDWRSSNSHIKPDLIGANLSRLTNTELKSGNFADADLSEVNLDYAYLKNSILRGANLRDTKCHNTTFIGACLCQANFQGANLCRANFYKSECIATNFSESDLSSASFVGTNIDWAVLDGCTVYGLSAWGLRGIPKSQLNLIVTPTGEPVVTVDRLEVAQFIYTLLENSKIRDVIDTITSKVVLILGRFTPERKAILDAIRDELRQSNYSPVLFDFDKPANKDVTGTVETLARMARFIIADLTDPSSIPHELATVIPHLRTTPIQPLHLAGTGGYSMFDDFKSYPWVLKTYQYETPERESAKVSWNLKWLPLLW